MSRITELRNDAYNLSYDGQYLAAHVALLQAAHEARLVGALHDRLFCLIEALTAGNKAHIPSTKRLELLIEIRKQMFERPDTIPKNTNYDAEGYIASEYFDYFADHKPVRKELEATLRDRRGVHPADAYSDWRRFYSLIGDDEKSLEFGEKSSAAYEKGKQDGSSTQYGSSSHRSAYLLNGFYAQLSVGGTDKAAQWLDGIERELRRSPCPNCKLNWLNAKIDLGLASARPLTELKAQVREAELQGSHLQITPYTNFIHVRVLLLDPGNGDPYDKGHPAYLALSRRLDGDSVDLATRYLRSLLTLDHRLAALRFIVGIPPVDDLYYATPQRLVGSKTAVFSLQALNLAQRHSNKIETKATSWLDFKKRTEKAQASVHRAMAYAKQMDELLECSWRQSCVEGRKKRINEITSFYTS